MSTVEELVIDIQNGTDRKNELYTAIYKFLYWLSKRYLCVASELGYEIDDLVSAAWFGVERAIKDFDPGKGYKFITYLKYHVNNAVCDFLGIRNKRQINTPLALDAEVNGAENITLTDTLEDKTITEQFERVEKADYYSALYNEIDKLPPKQTDVLKRHFLSNETLNSIARSYNVSSESVRQHERNALRALRKNKLLRDCYYEDFAYKHVGINAFNTTWTSSTEWAVIKMNSIREEDV